MIYLVNLEWKEVDVHYIERKLNGQQYLIQI